MRHAPITLLEGWRLIPGDSTGLSRPAALLSQCAVVFLVATPASLAATGPSLTLRVYSNGYAFVTQVVPVSGGSTSVQVPLLSGVVSNLVATDQNGSPLSYSFNSGETNVTVYTLGASSVTLRYDTDSLTRYNGTVWTLAYAAGYNASVILPQLSTLIYVSGTPYSVGEAGTSPEVALAPGSWRVVYGVSLGNATSVTTGTQVGSSQGPQSLPWLAIAALVLAATAVGALSVWWWRRRGAGAPGGALRPDDVQVLNYLREKGGRALEFEIRTKFALPKTSAWRQIKRLERLGYVKVTKMGAQNQIEIVKERGAGG